MKVFCRYPFTRLFSDSYGMMTPCCKATVNHPVPDAIGSGGTFPVAPVSSGILNYRNSPEMNQLRNDMLKQNPYTDLVKDVCRKCIYAEDHGLPSNRQPSDQIIRGRVMDIKLRVFGNSCNLQCYMCRPQDSTMRTKQVKKMMEFDPNISKYVPLGEDGVADFAIDRPEVFQQVIEDLVALAPKIHYLTIIGGEPFILQSHYELLDRLIECGEAKNITLCYHSNLTKNIDKAVDYMKKFKQTDVYWSVDGFGERDDYIRYPSRWSDVEENLNKILEYAEVQASVTLSALSILDLFPLADYCVGRGIKLHYNFVTEPEVCRPDSLHPIIRKRLIEKYRSTIFDFLIPSLEEEVENWEERWYDMVRYLEAKDYVDGTNYKDVFPELCDLPKGR